MAPASNSSDITGPDQAQGQATRWLALQRRAPFALHGDGTRDTFLYGVTSTGIVCRPDCPSRRPRRANTVFFDTLPEACAAGFRPCMRCCPDGASPAAQQAERVEDIRRYLEQRLQDDAPSLKQLAAVAGVSPFHLQRSFRAVLGVSPAAYLRQLRAQRLAETLDRSNVTGAIQAAGFGSASAAYRAPGGRGSVPGMTPTARKQRGRSARIRYTLSGSPLGRMLVATTERGLCSVAFADSDEALLEQFHREFARAEVIRDDGDLRAQVQAVLTHLSESHAAEYLPLDVRATAFQHRVWAALAQIPRGQTRTYAEVAASLGQPTATRAVARACASNPVAVLVPCHRVVGSGGALTGYRWGVERKRHLLSLEKDTGS